MPWYFVDRTEQIEHVRATAHTGESGMGRNTVPRHALDTLDDTDRMLPRLATVRRHLPADFPTTAPLGVAVRVAVEATAALDFHRGRRDTG
jgi:hypothetical protein